MRYIVGIIMITSWIYILLSCWDFTEEDASMWFDYAYVGFLELIDRLGLSDYAICWKEGQDSASGRFWSAAFYSIGFERSPFQRMNLHLARKLPWWRILPTITTHPWKQHSHLQKDFFPRESLDFGFQSSRQRFYSLNRNYYIPNQAYRESSYTPTSSKKHVATLACFQTYPTTS